LRKFNSYPENVILTGKIESNNATKLLYVRKKTGQPWEKAARLI